MTESPVHPALWPAPHASGAVDATVTVPGSKSVTNRALVLASLASEPGWLRRPLRSREDASAVKVYGSEARRDAYAWLMEITGSAGPLKEGSTGAVLHGELER
ncbi:3-phosphoshikimate 1-carboxyvinyltransferase, partial [Streptomyces rubiginosohelvolus]